VQTMGHEVHLVCPWNVEDGVTIDGVQMHSFRRAESRSRRWFLNAPRIYRKLLPLLKEVDLVHFHDLDILPWMAPLSLYRPVVYDVHENYPEEMIGKDWLPRPLRRPLYHLVYVVQWILSHWIGNVVLVSEHQEERDFKSRNLNKLRVRNYASLNLLNDVSSDYMTRPSGVVFLGMGNQMNGSGLLLEIADAIHRKHPDVSFYCSERFSDPAYCDWFKAERHRRGLERAVQILPFIPAHLIVREILNRGTIGLSPNLRIKQQVKGAHAKIYEYMAAGLPIVCSDLPDQVAAVHDNDAGLLGQPEDPQTFVDAIERLLADRAYACRLGQNGQRAFREKYSWESQMPALQRFYEQILGGDEVGDASRA